jgi:hypothetical protein
MARRGRCGPQAVIAAGGDRPPVAVAQQLPAGRGVPLLAMLGKPGHQGGRDRLPADGLPLLPQPDQALAGVQVIGPQRQRPAAAAGGLGVQPQQQRVELGIIAAVGSGLADLGQPVVGDGPPVDGRRRGLSTFRACSSGPPACSSGVRFGDFSPVWVSEGGLEHSSEGSVPRVVKSPAACSSAAETGEISPASVPEHGLDPAFR